LVETNKRSFCKVMVLLCILAGSYNTVVAQSLDEVRADYFEAMYDEEKAVKLFNLLNDSQKEDALYTAFKAGSYGIMCLHISNPVKRLKYINKACDYIDEAVAKEPENLEIRIMRFSMQSQIPKILGKHKNLNEDVLFLQKHLLTDDLTFLTIDAKLYIIKDLKNSKKIDVKKLLQIEQRLLSTN